MKTFTELLDEYVDATNDESTENRERGKRRINQRQRTLCARDYWWLEQEFALLSVANQQIYDLPAKFKKFKELVITVGDLTYPLNAYLSIRKFDEANQWGGITVTEYVEGYTVRDNKLYLVPPPSASNLVLSGVYVRNATTMRLEDYTAGTVSVSNGSKTVTGSGTSFQTTAKIRKGAVIFLDDEPYEIATADSNTQLTLSKKYEGTTLSGSTYRVGDVSVLPEEFQDLLWMGEAMMYYMKKDKEQFAKYKLEYTELKDALDKYASGRITENVISRKRKYFRNPNFNPRNIG